MGIFGKKTAVGWHTGDDDRVVQYFDGAAWRGKARLLPLDEAGPLPPGEEVPLLRQVEGLALEIGKLQTKRDAIALQVSGATEKIESLYAQHTELKRQVYETEVRFNDGYPTAADGSAKITSALKELRDRMKMMLRNGTALQLSTQMDASFASLVNVPQQVSKHLRESFSKLFLGYFNAECEAAVRQLRSTSSLLPSHSRILKARSKSMESGIGIGIQISEGYYRLRLDELEMVYEHLRAKEQERSEALFLREQQRDEARAQEEYIQVLTALEKELEHYQQMLDQMRTMGDLEGAARYENLLRDAEGRIDDIVERAANTRIGYVYVISNIGSFGEGVVKIGMTRRLEPLNRVKELSNASVPFKYDVHAMMFSMDAVSLETKLHQHFDDVRINTVNRRREFFRAAPREVLEALKDHNVDLVEWVEEPAAEEYRLMLGTASLP